MVRLTPHAIALASAGLLSTLPAWAQPASANSAEALQPLAQLQEVTVTAQKRRQASSKVPVALSVVGDEEIRSKGISTVANLTELVPNVQIGTGAVGGMDITIRGIGNSDNSERGDPQAAFHVDGVYIGRPQQAGATFFDLERVEVLRGPQGTLYGRNANAGAVNVITKKPGRKLAGEVGLQAGSHGTIKADAMLNVPVSALVAVRAVVSAQRHQGYSDTANASSGFGRDRDDQDNLSGRVQALIRFSADTSLLLGADAGRDQDAGVAYFDITAGVLPTSRTQNPQIEGRRDNWAGGMLSEFRTSLGAIELTYLLGHRKASRDEAFSLGNAPSPTQYFSNTYTQDSHELRLASGDTGPTQWVAGLYWFKETGRNIDLDVFLPPIAGGGRAVHFVQDPAISTSKSAFGQVTYSLAPNLRVTAGLRTTRDEKSRQGQTRVGPADTPIGVAGNSADGSWSKLTYRAGAEYDLSPAQMVYANVSTGYKAGGFNDGNGVAGDPNFNPTLYYKPEAIKAFEGGIKGRFIDNSLQLGASVFAYDYTDLQKSGVVNNSLNTINAGRATVTGVELEGRAAVGGAGRVNFALGLLSAKYKEYTAPGGQNFSGEPLDRAPKASLTLGYTHTWDFGDAGSLAAYFGTRYTSSYILSDAGTATQSARIFTQPSTTKSDLTLTFSPVDDRWSVQLFGKNLEDKSTLSGLFTLNGRNFAALSEPRTFGVRGNFKF